MSAGSSTPPHNASTPTKGTAQTLQSRESRQEERRVLGATLVGTTIEWYDFFICAQAAGLVFGSQFFTLGEGKNETLAQIFSWASLGISFLFRPLGAVIAGHLGDRFGRKSVLAGTLVLMGASTFLIGVLPTAATAGVVAPILLITLRILQGFSAGGEWGGAALLAVEHAPDRKRGKFGTYPQIGVPLGLSLATAVLLFMTLVVGKDAYVNWAWRVPFLFSFVLIIIGAVIRSRVSESPVFEEIRERATESSAPVGVLLKNHFPLTLKAALIFAANNATGYILMTYMGSYATKKLGMDQAQVFFAVIAAAIAWTLFTLFSGGLSDRIGRTQTFAIGYVLLLLAIFPAWLLTDTANIWAFTAAVLLLTPGLALSYGPQSALYAELFPREIRYSGVSISYAIGAILGGAFAPMIAEMLLNKTSTTLAIGVYLVALYVIALIALWFTPRDLHKRQL